MMTALRIRALSLLVIENGLTVSARNPAPCVFADAVRIVHAPSGW